SDKQEEEEKQTLLKDSLHCCSDSSHSRRTSNRFWLCFARMCLGFDGRRGGRRSRSKAFFFFLRRLFSQKNFIIESDSMASDLLLHGVENTMTRQGKTKFLEVRKPKGREM